MYRYIASRLLQTIIVLFIVSIAAMVVYFFWLFLSPDIIVWGRTLREWALIVPIALIVYAFLFVVAWIGWALASTPPSLPLHETP